MTLKKQYNIVLITLLIVFGVLVLIVSQYINQNDKISNYESSFKALTDSLHVTRNELNQSIGSISVLKVNRDDLLKLSFDKDSLMQVIQSISKENKRSTAIIVARLKNLEKGTTPTTITIDSTGSAVYTSNWSEEWSEGHIIATKDSIYRNIQTKHQYDTWITSSKKGTTVHWKSLNPNSIITGLSSYTVPTPPQKRLSIGVGVNYGVRPDFTFGPQFGIQVNYDLIQIK